MPLTKVSGKYQVVIPKKVRDKARIKEGQELNVYVLEEGILLTPKKKWPEDYIGSQKDIWQNVDVAKYLAEERDSWSRKK